MFVTSKNFVAVSLLAIAIAGCSNVLQGQSFTFEQIALTGDVGRGITDGAKFQDLSFPAINNNGEVAFIADLRQDHAREAIFGPIGDGGPPSLICRAGDTAFNATDGALFKKFAFVTLNDKGDLSFKSILAASNGEKLPPNNNEAIFGPTAGSGSPLGILLRSGDMVPGGVIRNDTKVFAIDLPLINNNGKVVFLSFVREIKETKQSGDEIICGPVGDSKSTWELLASTGSAVVGVADGEKITGLSVGQARINDKGAVSFFAKTESGMMVLGPALGNGPQLSVLAKNGQEAPGAKDGALYDFFKRRFQRVDLNDQGDVAFVARLSTGQGAAVTDDNDMGIFGPIQGAGSALGLIFREGDPAISIADGSAFGKLVTPPLLNDLGDIAFHCTLKTGSGGVIGNLNDDAIFGPTKGAGSPVGLIARDGDVVPEASDGAVLNLKNYYGPVINNRGSIAFLTDLRTGDGGGRVDESNDKAVFAYTDRKLRMVVRTGDPFKVALESGDNESRTISKINLTYSTTNNIMNDENTIVFGLEFTDGTSGIFTAAFPTKED